MEKGQTNQAFEIEDAAAVGDEGDFKTKATLELSSDGLENNNKDSVLSDLYSEDSSEATTTKVTQVTVSDVGNVKEEEEDEDTRCGFACFRPEWLQRFATKGYFMLIFSILAVVQGMGWSYMTGTITTIQKRFKISSQTTGIVISGNEISQVIFSVILGYYGGKGHRPRWIALGVLFSAAACVLLATPHFFYGAGHDALMLTEEYSDAADSMFKHSRPNTSAAVPLALHGSSRRGKVQLCSKAKTFQGDDCDSSDATILPLVFIFMSQFVAGIGVLLFFSLGGPYLDDNINKSNSPMLFGITMSLRLIGPTLGFIFASGCLKVYIAPHLTPWITSDDPRWLGAWWLGWLILGALMAVTAVLISLFPKKLPKTVEREKKAALDNAQVAMKAEKIGDSDVKQSLRQIFEDVKGLARNRVNLFNNLASFCYIFSAIGYWTYMPKYLETVFMQSAITASYVSGLVGIATQSAGLLLSGYLISKYKPSARFLSGWNIVIGCLYTIVKISFTQMGCSGERLTFEPDSSSSVLNLTTTCNSGCNCPTNKFSPVCSKSTNQLFYSACHAGCTSMVNGTTSSYSNCSCLPSPTDTVQTGNCNEGCWNMFLMFLALNAVIKLIDGSGRVGNMLVSYRCVHPKDKSLSISLTIGLLSLFAFLPGPILFGYIFDSVCLIWGSKCGGKGNCWMYDGEKLRYAFNLTAAGVTFMGAFFDIFVWYYAKDLDLYDEDKNLERWAKEKAEREERKRQKNKMLK